MNPKYDIDTYYNKNNSLTLNSDIDILLDNIIYKIALDPYDEELSDAMIESLMRDSPSDDSESIYARVPVTSSQVLNAEELKIINTINCNPKKREQALELLQGRDHGTKSSVESVKLERAIKI